MRRYLFALPFLLACACDPGAPASSDPDTAGAPFTIDGVGLYPGTRVTRSMRDNRMSGYGRTTTGLVVSFDTPASAGTVAAWYEAQMRRRGFSVNRAAGHIQATSTKRDKIDIVISDRPQGSAGTLTVNSSSEG